MPETITTRVARIIAGGTHALLDKIEDLAPDAIMAQSIREIEQIIAEIRLDLGKAEAAKHLVTVQIAKLQSEHDTLSTQITHAVSQQRDDLAKAAIGRQTDIEDFLPVLQKSLAEQSERSTLLASYISALLAKKRELEQILNDYLATQTDSGNNRSAQPTLSDKQSRIDNAESAFERALTRQLGVSGLQAGALEDAAKLKELADLKRSNRIAERLAAIKLTSESAKD
ncbi:MAG: PspA/IM30 family protein [Methylococcales bacterium]